jgi:hypothetical protein
LLTELGDVTRFDSPRQLTSYLGLTPSEYSSGAAEKRGKSIRDDQRVEGDDIEDRPVAGQDESRQPASGNRISPRDLRATPVTLGSSARRRPERRGRHESEHENRPGRGEELCLRLQRGAACRASV